MFEFGRELKRIFGGQGAWRPTRDGLAGGDAALLELLDLRLLKSEGKAADIAAGRISAKDRPQRRLQAAIVWREVARRTGEAEVLRKAAAQAEAAAEAFGRDRRPDGWARARCEQAFCALLGAELFGDDGLNAAAEAAFREARDAARGGLARPLAELGLTLIEGRRRLNLGDAQAARVVAARFDQPVNELRDLGRRCSAAHLLVAEARTLRADLLAAWGARLKDESLLQMAHDEAAAVAGGLDGAYEPLAHARACALRGQTLALMGETTGEVEQVLEAVTCLADVAEDLTRDHSPLDWARIHAALGFALQTLGDATAGERAYEQAVTCYERAGTVLSEAPALALRAQASNARALCLARAAELSGDLAVLDAAEAAFKMELGQRRAGLDPVSWALAQVNLARIYEARLDITGKDRGERASAALALQAALDVFAEQGLRSFSLIAIDAMERMRLRAIPRDAV